MTKDQVKAVLARIPTWPDDRQQELAELALEIEAELAGDGCEAAPDELTAYAGLISMPDGTPAMGVMACYCGDLTEGERVLKPLRAFGSPVFDAIQPMPFPMMQKLVDEMSPDGTHNYWR